jgi:acetyl/propionyl-CoA carboxylase alpha subunit
VKFEAEHGGRTVPVEVTGGAGRYTLVIEGATVTVDARQTVEGIWSILWDGASYVADVTERETGYAVDVEGERYTIRVEEESRYLIRTRGATGAERGQVTLVEVTVGQTVAPGDGLIVLEAMKMENEFKAAVAGTVKEIRVEAGQAVNPGDVLVVIE